MPLRIYASCRGNREQVKIFEQCIFKSGILSFCPKNNLNIYSPNKQYQINCFYQSILKFCARFQLIFSYIQSINMNSQVQYHLSFNPRGQPKYSKGEKQTRYIPQLKQNKPTNIPWRQNAEYQFDQQPLITTTTQPQTRQFKIPLSPNDSGYLSNKSNSAASRRVEESQKRQQQRKKEQIIKRVKQLQEKVLPLVDRQHNDEEDGLESGWQSRIELKLVRIETCLDGIRKEWEVEMQKKLAEIESAWQSKFQEVTSRVYQK